MDLGFKKEGFILSSIIEEVKEDNLIGVRK